MGPWRRPSRTRECSSPRRSRPPTRRSWSSSSKGKNGVQRRSGLAREVKNQMFISEKSRYIRSCEERKTKVRSEMKNPIPKMQSLLERDLSKQTNLYIYAVQ